jgi:hypothetical protein
MKKIIVLLMIICQFVLSCSSDDSSNNLDGLGTDIDALIALPYSKLSPSEQKVKLENEANSMLLQMENSKSLTAEESIENMENLLNISPPEFQMANSGNGFRDLLNISGVYGIYTWNATQQIWVKTSSSTELKFKFPSNQNTTSNDAVLTVTSVASNIKVDVIDTEGIGYWEYNSVTYQNEYVITDPAIYDQIYLPSSVNAVLTINGTLSGIYEANAVYSNGNPEPTEAGYKLTLDGYVWENRAKRTTPISVKSSFSYDGKNLIDFNVGSTADIDKLIEGSELTQYLGKANCLITLMDNFVIVADMNVEGLANDSEDLNKIPEPDYNNPTTVSAYNKTISEGEVSAFNKNVKMAFVSKKDGTKLADVVLRSVKGEIYYDYQEEYDANLFLKFGDGSEVAMDVYFSSGFDNLTTKFKDFINSFNQ